MWLPFGGSWGFPNIRGTIFGGLILRIVVYWGLYWGPPTWGKYHVNSIKEPGWSRQIQNLYEVKRSSRKTAVYTSYKTPGHRTKIRTAMVAHPELDICGGFAK